MLKSRFAATDGKVPCGGYSWLREGSHGGDKVESFLENDERDVERAPGGRDTRKKKKKRTIMVKRFRQLEVGDRRWWKEMYVVRG